MNREIKKKWKAFAAEQTLAMYDDSFEPDEIFDLLVNAHTDELDTIVRQVRVQFQFENNELDIVDFVWHMHQLASNAQQIEEANE